MRRRRTASPTTATMEASQLLQHPSSAALVARRPSTLLPLLLSFLLSFTSLTQHKAFTLAAAADVVLPPPDATTPVPLGGTTTEHGLHPLRKYLPTTMGNEESENEEVTAQRVEAAGPAQKGRDVWPPYRNMPAIALQTTGGKTWKFSPNDGTESVLFVLVERSLKYLPTFEWEEEMTGLSPWSSRPNLTMVFVPRTDPLDAYQVAQEAHTALSSNTDDAEYWLPRMHFSLDTMDSLRSSGSWFTDYVAAWSVPAPSVAVLADLKPNGTEQSLLDLFDATPPTSGLAMLAPGAPGACGDGIVGATCGKVAFFGTACLEKDRDNRPVPPQPVQDVEGKVALVARGGCTFSEKVKVLKSSGAVAAIIYSDDKQRSPWLATEDGGEGVVVKPETFPLVLIDREPGQVLRGMTMDTTLVEKLAVTIFERASPPWAFAADRFGRFRRLVRGYGSLAAAVLEATSFEFESLVAQTNPPAADLGLNPTTLTVDVLEGGGGGEGGRAGESVEKKSATEAVVEIPSYITERPNGGLHLKINLMCPDREEENCPRWASFIKIYACEVPLEEEEESGHHHRHHHFRHLSGVDGDMTPANVATAAAATGGILKPDIYRQRAQTDAPPPIDTSGGNRNITPSLTTHPTSTVATDAAGTTPPTSRPSIPAQQPRDALPHDVGAEGRADNDWDPRVWQGCGGEVVELGRLVSPAGREMLTLVEASPFLAALPLKGTYRRGGGSGAYHPYTPKIKVFVLGAEGYNVSLSFLFTAANPGDLVPFKTFRVSSLQEWGKGGQQGSSPSQSIPLPRGVPSYALVAAITAQGSPSGSDIPSTSHMFRIQEDAPATEADAPPSLPPPPLEWTVPLIFQSQPFGCSNLTLTRSGVVPNQLGDWYSSQPGFCPGQPVALKQFFMSRAPSSGRGGITVTYIINDVGNEESEKGRNVGGGGNPPLGAPGHVDLEAYLVTYAFLPETPEVSAVAFVNASVLPPSLAPPSPSVSSSSSSVGSSVTTQNGHTTLTLRLPGPPVQDGQDAVISFPPPFLDPNMARMPVDLYRVSLSERISGNTLVYTFPVSAPADLSTTATTDPPVARAPVNSQAVQVQVLNSSAAFPSQEQENNGAGGMGDNALPSIPPLAPTEGSGGHRRVQATTTPPPSLSSSLPPSMQLVLQNLVVRTDYLVKISAVSSAGPSRASVLTVNVPGTSSSPPSSPSPSSSRRRRRRHHDMKAGQQEEGEEEWESSGMGAGEMAGVIVGVLGAVALVSMLGMWVWRGTARNRFFSLGEEGGRTEGGRTEGGGGVVTDDGEAGAATGAVGMVRGRGRERKGGEEEEGGGGEEEEEEGGGGEEEKEVQDWTEGRGGERGGGGRGERPMLPRTRSVGSPRRSVSLGSLNDYEIGRWETDVGREEEGGEGKREGRPIFDLV